MKISIRQNVGKGVKEYRIKRGYTQEKLAEVTGIDYKYLQKIEGKNTPNIKLETIEKLAKAFQISPSKLLDF